MKAMTAAGWVTGLLLAMGIAGCAAAQAERPMNPTLESITETVLEDAARRTGIDRPSLTVERAIAVTWPDGSLGCPQPGMNYTMALVPGFRIIVRAGEQRFDYHATRRGYFVLCPAGLAEEPAVDALK
jgi:hypothetical protein